MSIICGNCGHDNQEDAAYCDECGEELATSTSSYEEEDSASSEESYDEESSGEESDYGTYAEASSSEESSDESYDEESSGEESSSEESSEQSYDDESSGEESSEQSYDEESSSEESEQLKTEILDTEEPEDSTPSLPIGAATRLEIDEPPIVEMASPPTTLELPELPTAVLIDQETGERFVLPSEEKTSYIGRINDEFPIQVDLSSILNADLISRVHAAIHYENEIYYLEDAGSANGTWLNETELQSGTRFRKQLNPGDTIAFGRNQTVKFTFNLED